MPESVLPSRVLGVGGPEVSAVGLGAMALSFAKRPTFASALRVIHAALDGGVRFIDTADVYAPDAADLGHNERLIAKALRSYIGPRESIVVATKGGYVREGQRLIPNGHPSYLRRACERSLRTLSRSEIDLYQLHTPDPRVPLEESVGVLSDLRDEGKIRFIGLSNVTLVQIAAARAIVPIHSVQNQFSLLHRAPSLRGPVSNLELRGVRGIRQLRRLLREPFQSGVLEYCGRHGLAFLAWSPFGGSRHASLANLPGLIKVAQEHSASAHAVAIAWLLRQGAHVIPIPSARSVEHVRGTLSGATLQLTADQLKRIVSC